MKFDLIIGIEEIKFLRRNWDWHQHKVLRKQREAIYFIFGKNNKILYIGHTTNTTKRIATHVKSSVFKEMIQKVKFIFPKSFKIYLKKDPLIIDLEYWFIRKYKPPYNKRRDDPYKQTYVYVADTEKEKRRIYLLGAG